MPSDSDHYRLIHIQDNIAKANLFVAGMTYEQFRDDERTFYAVTRALEIISEASRKLSVELKSRHPTLAWKDMAGAGSVYRHDYEDVIQQLVWRTVQEALPPLLRVVEVELARVENGG